MSTPLDNLPFPVTCKYPGCGVVLESAIEVDEHITEEHLPEAIWNFADDNMRFEP